jgi:hypothetical protein
MKKANEALVAAGWLCLFESAWYLAFWLFREVIECIVEKCHLRSDGSFSSVLRSLPNWRVGWLLICCVPVVSLVLGAFMWRRHGPALAILAILVVQFAAALVGPMMVVDSVVRTSWALWW